MSNIYGKIVDSMQKVFPAAEPTGEEYGKTILQNERLNFQLAYKNDTATTIALAGINVEGELAPFVTIRSAELVPAQYFPQFNDTYVISQLPGLYPDVLKPLGAAGVVLPAWQWKAFYVSAENPQGFAAGVYTLTFVLRSQGGEELSRLDYKIEVLPISARETDLKITNWMHYDGIASKHGVKLFDDEFYLVFAGYLREYVRAGNNMLLTPLFTPPLDTEIGGERRTAQLIGVKLTANGGYEFDFKPLEKFGEFAFAHGVKYLEFSHLFTQWGGKCCPKIMAETENGEEKKIFGWESDSLGEEYAAFLNAFLPRLVSFLKREHIEKISYFHLTDEPAKRHLPVYAKCRERVKKHLKTLPVFDALSDFEFYEKGLVDIPVPELDKSAPFFAAGVKEMFVYYCTPFAKYPNRSMNMPLLRVRVLGALLYLCGAQGFLHWGFNFYNTQNSLAEIDPCADTSAGHCFFSGDQFIVYPYRGGAAGSLRAEAIAAGFYDYRALKTLERRAGRDHVLRLLNEAGVKSFTEYPHSAEKFDALMENVIREIAEA